jgi:hypothetical protein
MTYQQKLVELAALREAVVQTLLYRRQQRDAAERKRTTTRYRYGRSYTGTDAVHKWDCLVAEAENELRRLNREEQWAEYANDQATSQGW